MTVLDELTFRPAHPENDLQFAYERLFKPGIEKAVRELTADFNKMSGKGPAEGEWPETRYDFFKKGFSDPDMMMISHKGEDIGCYCISHAENAIILQRVYLREDYQRLGIGAMLVQKALDEAHRVKKPLELEVLANNTRAINSYRKSGFIQSSPEVCSGWNRKFEMRHRDTYQYLFTSWRPAPARRAIWAPMSLA